MLKATLSLIGSHGPYLVGHLADDSGRSFSAALDPSGSVRWRGEEWRPYHDAYDPRLAGVEVACEPLDTRILGDGSIRVRISPPRQGAAPTSLDSFLDAADHLAGTPLHEDRVHAIAPLQPTDGAAAQIFAQGGDAGFWEGLAAEGRIVQRSALAALERPRWQLDRSGRSTVAFDESPLEDHHLASFGGYARIMRDAGGSLDAEDLAGLARIISRSGDGIVIWRHAGETLIASPVLTGGEIMTAESAFAPRLERLLGDAQGLSAWTILSAASMAGPNRDQAVDPISLSLARDRRRGDPFDRAGVDRATYLYRITTMLQGEAAEMAARAVIDMPVYESQQETPR